ncbi:MAG: helix-turn-helix domain-containing protein [Spirochaetaceae bacterium]|jgi:AraC-like DNA-binding protein/ligand-binding sensor protein|nr:helix-turn-helix domain-containing protein [Spirochaetaceae bacterium]
MWRNNPSLASIIGRREIEPLFIRAGEALKPYEEATGTAATVLDLQGRSAGEEHNAICFKFCEQCMARNGNQSQGSQGKTDAAPDGIRANTAAANNDAAVIGGASGGPSGTRDAPAETTTENPCAALHASAVRRACRTGEIYIYKCEGGLLFWMAPLFANGHSPGALIAAAEGKTREEVTDLAELLHLAAEQISRFSGEVREAGRNRVENPPEGKIRLVRREEAEPDLSWPLDRERVLIAALRRGDGDAWRKALGELLDYIQGATHNDFDFMRHRVMELTVLLSRAALSPGKRENYGEVFGTVRRAEDIPSPDGAPSAAEIPWTENPAEPEILENNNRWFRRIQDATSAKELAGLLRLIAERLSSNIFSFKGVRHASALRRAERFIWDNYTRKISLDEIARASGLSGPYFSSIFKEEMGEKLSNYLNRLRVERAMTLLAESDKSLNDIAASCGFEDQSWFSKIFKSFTGVTPGKYREQGQGGFSAQEPREPRAFKSWADIRFSPENRRAENSKETG